MASDPRRLLLALAGVALAATVARVPMTSVILPLCLLPLLIVLETMTLVRSVNALRDPLRA